MEWNVIWYNSNTRKFEIYNVLRHREKDIQMLIDKSEGKKKNFSKLLDKEMMYYYWNKCEYEVILSDWPGEQHRYKLDIYNQLKLNWRRFVDYCWTLGGMRE